MTIVLRIQSAYAPRASVYGLSGGACSLYGSDGKSRGSS